MAGDDLHNEKADLRKIEVIDGKINFVCLREQCPTSCCGPFGGVQKGIDSIAGKKFSEIVLTPEDAQRIIAAGFSHFVELCEDGHYRMRVYEDGTCSALKENRCSIHPVKPTVCRAFPLYVDMFVGLCGVTACPGFGAGWTPVENLKGEVEAAKTMYQFWLDSIVNKPGEER
jgi:Fe-S-cluster containining protein